MSIYTGILWIQNGISIHHMIGLCCTESWMHQFCSLPSKKASNMFTNMPWKPTCHLKRHYFNRKYIFQPLIFRGHPSFARRSGSFFREELNQWRTNWIKLVSLTSQRLGCAFSRAAIQFKKFHRLSVPAPPVASSMNQRWEKWGPPRILNRSFSKWMICWKPTTGKPKVAAAFGS